MNIPESVIRHNAMIEAANKRLAILWQAGIRAQGSLCATGVTIAIERPGWHGSRVTFEVIPY